MTPRIKPARARREEPKVSNRPKPLERIVQIVLEHLHFTRAQPAKVAQIARRLGVSHDSVLAIAIADHVVEEFNLDGASHD
jgi:hypothetical protein